MKMKPHSLLPSMLTTTFVLVAIILVIMQQQQQQLRVSATTIALGNETDRMALLAIKSQLFDHHSGGGVVLSSWNHSIHHCLWDGVTCGSKHMRVVDLELYSRGLAGTISPFIGNLSFVKNIWLYNNSLRGQIPPEIGNLFRLQELDFDNNTLIGEIPGNISGCINLVNLSVSYNNLHGSLPTGLGALSNLKRLWLSNSNLSGPLFKVISNLTSLEIIYGEYNSFTGTIPDDISRMTNLNELALESNKLSGMIPPSIFNLSSLQTLDLGMNQLRGSIPPGIAYTLTRLQFLGLESNHLSGPFPISLPNLTSLQVIVLACNNFTGSVPTHFGHLHNLTWLHLSENNLVGDIDFISSLINCSKLEKLVLYSNNFTGRLPQAVANLSTNLVWFYIGNNPLSQGDIPIGITNLINLRRLDLSTIGLTGTIPQGLGKLRNLEGLWLFSNRLTGEIPSSFGNLSHLTTLSLFGNQLQGKIPPSLGNCANLLYLYLFNNQFNGSLPNELFTKTNFIELKFDQNLLEGSLPIEISKQINLDYISLSNNRLWGKIPDIFSSLPNLQYLDMGNNFFHGPIPPSFASLKSLSVIDLSQNNLSGFIPEYFSSFPLTFLNLSYNKLEGRVPTEGVFVNASAISLVGNNGLCGGIPELHLPRCVEEGRKKRKMSRPLLLVTTVFVSAFVGVLVIIASIWLYLISHTRKKHSVSSNAQGKEPFLKVSYDMLLNATSGFGSENLLGSGTFGSVFKGILDGKMVAVKVLNLQQRGGSKSFMAECEVLRNIRHRNLVGILTVCSSTDFQRNDFKALVYEFMPNGSLDKWLHEDGYMSLLQRLDIAIDVAHALQYLHCECVDLIVHCDLKPSNILLDHDMVAHVADFGLAKILGQPLHPNQSSSIGVRGTVGYVAPEYGLGGEASPEADLYSFGILLLELMTRKRPTNEMFKEDLNLHMYAKGASPDQVMQIVDTTQLMEHEDDETDNRGPHQATFQIREECIISVVKIGVACSNQVPHHRMNITTAISELQQARKLLKSLRRRDYLPRGAF